MVFSASINVVINIERYSRDNIRVYAELVVELVLETIKKSMLSTMWDQLKIRYSLQLALYFYDVVVAHIKSGILSRGGDR